MAGRKKSGKEEGAVPVRQRRREREGKGEGGSE